MTSSPGRTEPVSRQARPFVGTATEHSVNYKDFPGSYLDDPAFAPGHHSLVRASAVLDRDLDRLFDYIEPCDENAECFSHQTFGHLGRAAMEAEALLTLSLSPAGITPKDPDRPNMGDYKQLEDELKLSDYEVRLPIWKQPNYSFRPFDSFRGNLDARRSPDWWKRYNHAKHDRATKFDEATLTAAIHATGAALVCLFAQVAGRSLGGVTTDLFHSYLHDDGWIAGDRLFEIRPPKWEEAERYSFDPEAGTASHM